MLTDNLIPFLIVFIILSSISFWPIKDERGPYKSLPIMTLSLIGINVGVFIWQYVVLPQQIGSDAASLFVETRLLLVPASVLSGSSGQGAITMLTSAFLHGGWLHLADNMFFLLFFGRKVEDILGPVRLGLLYMVCLFVSQIGSVICEVALPSTRGLVPSLGASGAVMGLIGAYLFLYHGERIRTLVLLNGILPFPIPIPLRMSAAVFVFYMILRDVLNGWLEQQVQQQLGLRFSYVDSFAHLSGLIAGLLGMYLFLPAAILHYQYQSTDKRKERELKAN